MPAASDRDDLADLKAALLNFVVRELRGHAEELGPLSQDITRAIAEGTRTAVAESLRDFEARRLERLTEELWARIEPELRRRTDDISRDLAAGLSQALEQSSAELDRRLGALADARVQAAVTEAFCEPQVRQSVNNILLGVSNLQTTLQAVLDGDEPGAQASAADGTAAAQAAMAQTHAAPVARPGGGGRDVRRLRPMLIAGGAVLVLLMLGGLGLEAWRMGVLPGSSAEADPRPPAAAAPAADATAPLAGAASSAVEDARTAIADANAELQRRAEVAGPAPAAAAAKGRLKQAQDLSQRIGALSQRVAAARAAHDRDALWKAGGEARELGRLAAGLAAASGPGPS